MEEQAANRQNRPAKPTFDRSEAIRRVWLMMNSPHRKQVKKKKPEANPGGGTATKTVAVDRCVKVGGRRGKYPRVRKYPENPAAGEEQESKPPVHKHYNETEEQRSERLAGYMERYRAATQNESPEERQKRLEALEEEKKMKNALPYTGRIRSNRYENETEEQRQKRLAKYARNFRNKLENETPEKRERRLEFAKISAKRSLDQKRLKKKQMMEKNADSPVDVSPAPDAVAKDPAKGIKESQAHLEFAKVVTERRRMVADAVDKEHLEDLVAIAEESLLLNMKREPPDLGENSTEIANGQEISDRFLSAIKTEKPDGAGFEKNLLEMLSAPVNRVPSLQIKAEKPDREEMVENSLKLMQLSQREPEKPDGTLINENFPKATPVAASNPRLASNEIPVIHLKAEKPDNAVAAFEKNLLEMLSGPAGGLQAPVIETASAQIGKEKPESTEMSENSTKMTLVKSPQAVATNAPLLQIQSKNGALIGKNLLEIPFEKPDCILASEQFCKMAPAVVSNPRLTANDNAASAKSLLEMLSSPANEIPSVQIKTEKLDHIPLAENLPDMTLVNNLQAVPTSAPLLKAQPKNPDGVLVSENFPGMAPPAVASNPWLAFNGHATSAKSLLEMLTSPANGLPASGNATTSVQIKTEKLDRVTVAENSPNVTLVNSLQAVPPSASLLKMQPKKADEASTDKICPTVMAVGAGNRWLSNGGSGSANGLLETPFAPANASQAPVSKMPPVKTKTEKRARVEMAVDNLQAVLPPGASLLKTRHKKPDGGLIGENFPKALTVAASDPWSASNEMPFLPIKTEKPDGVGMAETSTKVTLVSNPQAVVTSTMPLFVGDGFPMMTSVAASNRFLVPNGMPPLQFKAENPPKVTFVNNPQAVVTSTMPVFVSESFPVTMSVAASNRWFVSGGMPSSLQIEAGQPDRVAMAENPSRVMFVNDPRAVATSTMPVFVNGIFPVTTPFAATNPWLISNETPVLRVKTEGPTSWTVQRNPPNFILLPLINRQPTAPAAPTWQTNTESSLKLTFVNNPQTVAAINPWLTSTEMPVLHVKTEKPDDFAPTGNSPKITSVNNSRAATTNVPLSQTWHKRPGDASTTPSAASDPWPTSNETPEPRVKTEKLERSTARDVPAKRIKTEKPDRQTTEENVPKAFRRPPDDPASCEDFDVILESAISDATSMALCFL